MILASVVSAVGDSILGNQYTVQPNSIVSRIPGATSYGNLWSPVSGAKVDGDYYAIGVKDPDVGTGTLSVYEVDGSNGLQNENATAYLGDMNCVATKSRIIICPSGSYGNYDVYSVLDDTLMPSTDSLRFMAYDDISEWVALRSALNNNLWVGKFDSGATDTGENVGAVEHIDSDGSVFVLTEAGGFPPTRTITKFPSPYTSSSVVSTGITSTTTFIPFDDDNLLISSISALKMYDNDLSLKWSKSITATNIFSSYPKLVKDGHAILRYGTSGGSASSRRMLSIDIDTGDIKWDRTNVMMSSGGFGSSSSFNSSGGMIFDDVNNRLICSRNSVPIGSVISE